MLARECCKSVGAYVDGCIEDALARLSKEVLKKHAGFRFGPEELQLYAFSQTWGNTSCGWGGIAGQAFTRSMTVVILNDYSTDALVYLGRFAYHVKNPNIRFHEDLRRHCMLGIKDHKAYEGVEEQC